MGIAQLVWTRSWMAMGLLLIEDEHLWMIDQLRTCHSQDVLADPQLWTHDHPLANSL